ncbi:MAG: hypothetical protein K0S74_537 [Chlamydiales bacterium]|nr:hypothetical protein [Chlamydiales bacterium]
MYFKQQQAIESVSASSNPATTDSSGKGKKNSGISDSEVELSQGDQSKMDELTRQAIAEIRAEQRLNLTMTAQLRTYRTMLNQLQSYAKKVENDIDMAREISKNDFQENVELQAGLFTGKKPELVARHLEEFEPIRIGAILAKMKEKEAAQVLDVWAIATPIQKGESFYRDVMGAYLANRRHDIHPELFSTINTESINQPTQNPVEPEQPVRP